VNQRCSAAIRAPLLIMSPDAADNRKLTTAAFSVLINLDVRLIRSAVRDRCEQWSRSWATRR
jgi:hypothetical protein